MIVSSALSCSNSYFYSSYSNYFSCYKHSSYFLSSSFFTSLFFLDSLSFIISSASTKFSNFISLFKLPTRSSEIEENLTLTFSVVWSSVAAASLAIALAVAATASYLAITIGSSSGGNILSAYNWPGHLFLNIWIFSFQSSI